MVQFDENKSLRREGELRAKEAEQLAQYLAIQYGIPYVDLSLVSVNPNALGLIDENLAKVAQVAGFHLATQSIDVATFSPRNKQIRLIVDDLAKRGYKVNLFITTERSLEVAWRLYADVRMATRSKAGQIDISDEDLADLVAQFHTVKDTKKAIADALSSEGGRKVTQILEIVLGGGIAAKASDIHIEAETEQVRVRYRLDGILHDIENFDHHTYRLLLARIKLLSGLKLNVGSMRQDGRFSVSLGKSQIDIRTSIIPGSDGESIVMRILDPVAISKLTLEDLGMSARLLEVVRNTINKPNGMILTTGPTGSGKTTSLYAFIKTINEPGIKIITIEDPVEYHMEGVVQTQADVKKGYTFLEGLKSAMRQDPDILMVGEIRDSETAGTAIDASLTGHLVFSTLHTNNAAGTIPRLLDLMVNPKVIGPALTLSMAQRLIRRLCVKCKITGPITKEEREIIDGTLRSLTHYDLPNLPPKAPGTLARVREGGCAVCGGIGYKGRVGVYEAILIDRAVEQVIPNNPGEYEIWNAALPQKLPNMVQDGILKILEGLSTIEELRRVLDLDRAVTEGQIGGEDKDNTEEKVGDLDADLSQILAS